MESLQCFQCSQTLYSLHELAAHLKTVHNSTLSRNTNDSAFICGQNGCFKSYVDFYNLRRHIKQKHLQKNEFVSIQLMEHIKQRKGEVAVS